MNDLFESKIKLPLIKKVFFSGFDLYSNQPNISTDIDKSIYCLIGANGLGKSTFLNAVMYAITGAIPLPSRNFKSGKEYATSASRQDRINDYFSGRITEASRENARVGVLLSWPELDIEIERELFGEQSVISLKTTSKTDNSEETTELFQDLKTEYKELIIKQTNLNHFSQFVFLFHFVSLFDEERHLLMWEDKALSNVLYIAFGTTAEFAEQQDLLRHEMEREGSRARNARFAAQHIQKRLDALAQAMGLDLENDIEIEQIKAQIEHLESEIKDADERRSRKQSELKDIELKWAEKTSLLSETQIEYKNLFNQRLLSSSSPSAHPLIMSSVSDDVCGICGTHGISEKIQRTLNSQCCPLCDTEIIPNQEDDKQILNSLKNLDQRISNTKSELEDILKTRARLSKELDASEKAYLDLQQRLDTFISNSGSNAEIINSLYSNPALSNNVREGQLEKDALIAKSKEHYQKRDNLRDQLLKYEKKLASSYEYGSQSFVPRFRELSEKFIGLPIDIELDQKSGKTQAGFSLQLRMKDQLRLEADTLSESQRFFIDIALRMTLLEKISRTPTTMLIDTPEGSLDIAYEARAGNMFSTFTQDSNQIIMTANLRSSHLVLRLSELKTQENMKIVKMTEWTELSEVQREEEALFTKAYKEIESALHKKNEQQI